MPLLPADIVLHWERLKNDGKMYFASASTLVVPQQKPLDQCPIVPIMVHCPNMSQLSIIYHGFWW
jgi:hypothetical protein